MWSINVFNVLYVIDTVLQRERTTLQKSTITWSWKEPSRISSKLTKIHLKPKLIWVVDFLFRQRCKFRFVQYYLWFYLLIVVYTLNRPDVSKILVSIGYQFFLELTHLEATKFIAEKVKLIDKRVKALEEEASHINADIKIMLNTLAKLQDLTL